MAYDAEPNKRTAKVIGFTYVKKQAPRRKAKRNNRKRALKIRVRIFAGV